MQVFRIFNNINGKSYIGITKWRFSERYPKENWYHWTSNRYLQKAVEKHGLENFDWEILLEGNYTEGEYERLKLLYVKQYDSLIPNGYNFASEKIKEYEVIGEFGKTYRIIRPLL